MKDNQSHAWINRCKETYRYHCNRLKANPNWTLRNTADTLSRSIGAVSQDLTLASWMFTHEEELKQFEFAKDALKFVRDRQSKINRRPLD